MDLEQFRIFPATLLSVTLRVGQDIALILTCYVTALTFLWSHISFPTPALCGQCTIAPGRREYTQCLWRQPSCVSPPGTFSSSSPYVPNAPGCLPFGTVHAAEEPGREQPVPQSRPQAQARAAGTRSASSPPCPACSPGASAPASPPRQALAGIFNCTVLIRSREQKAGQKNKQSKKGYAKSGRQGLLQTRTTAG